MKNLIPLLIVIIAMSFYLGCVESKSQQANLNLNGFWEFSYSECKHKGERTEDQAACPYYDGLLSEEMKSNPLGTHLLIKEDSISLFRYPYEYYGTFKYTIVADSLFIKSDYSPNNKFSIQKPDEQTLTINFSTKSRTADLDEEFHLKCIVPFELGYERFIPDPEIINKLIQDTISFDPLIGKWWYLKKGISSEDGGASIFLIFPKGMPDSIFVSKEIINQDIHPAFIELELNNRIVKMLIKEPSEYSYSLIPELKEDEVLFNSYIDNRWDGGEIDTSNYFYRVIYESYYTDWSLFD